MGALTTVHEIWRGASIVEHRGPGWRYGSWRCTPDREVFRDINISGSDALVVFPVYPVRVLEVGRRPFIANRNVAVLRNPGAAYRLEALVPEGDTCMWVALDRAWLRALLGARVEQRPEAPFVEARRLLPARSWLTQHLSFRLVERDDALVVPEVLMALLERVFAAPAVPRHLHRELAYAAETLLSTRFAERLSLLDVAAALGCTQWHLARVFRAELGVTLHQYREQLRLRAALDRLRDPSQSLASLAFDLGYSSHSHLSARFRETFGVRPSAVRDAGRHELRRLSALGEPLARRSSAHHPDPVTPRGDAASGSGACSDAGPSRSAIASASASSQSSANRSSSAVDGDGVSCASRVV